MKIISLISVLFISLNSWSLQPDRNYLAHPDSLGLNFEALHITTEDGASLHTWVLLPSGGINLHTTVILAYADAGNMSYWLDHCAVLCQNGFTVVMFDYRGFGESSDFEINANQLYYEEFTKDLSAVYHYAKKQYPSFSTGVWALSMGTIVTGFLLERENPDFVILEGLVNNPSDIQKKVREMKSKEVILPSNHQNLADIYTNSTVPMLIISGSEDAFTTSIEAKRVADNKPNRRIIEFEGNHLQGFQSLSKETFGDGYVRSLIDFIQI